MGVAHIQNPSKIMCPFLDYCYTNMIADDLQDQLIKSMYVENCTGMKKLGPLIQVDTRVIYLRI